MAMAANVMGSYEAIARASQAMLNAARDSDWDTVASLERDCAVMIDEVRRSGGARSLDDMQSRRRIEIMQKLLAEDAEIRNLAQPWLAGLQVMLCQPRLRAGSGSCAFDK
jgi:flagellar protein FliT